MKNKAGLILILASLIIFVLYYQDRKKRHEESVRYQSEQNDKKWEAHWNLRKRAQRAELEAERLEVEEELAELEAEYRKQ